MISTWNCTLCRRQIHFAKNVRSFVTYRALLQANVSAPKPQDRQNRTRNIGIIAHIDAGKTTTTERMLYYSGFTRRIGNVDEGSTVTDFLPAERARGITIQSAAITFHWPQQSSQNGAKSQSTYTINLIDTPGHADFTFEVVRSLRVLDGAICILDGVAGVEAQTEKVWHQANNYQIPRLIYVNKLDRDGASFHKTVKDIASHLHTFPALCQIPWWRNGEFIGLGDVVHLHALEWKRGSDGSDINSFDLDELAEKDPNFLEEIKKARTAIIEALTEHDEELVELFLEANEDWLAIQPSALLKSLREILLTKGQVLTPVFVGASFKNIGVQPLLDAINALLPSPHETIDPEISFASETDSLRNFLNGGTLELSHDKTAVADARTTKRPTALVNNLTACALAFKVVMDSKRGALVYVRVYQGSINRSDLLYNTTLAASERAQRLLRMYASEAVEIDQIREGEIGVIAGLKHARTGDTLIVYAGANQKIGPPTPLKTLQLRPIDVPPPLFFTSIEPHSLTEGKHLSDCLGQLLREDPSLNVSIDAESGQTHLAGMGELHLEIARDRLLNDFKVKASTGKIEIAYREAVQASSAWCNITLDREIAGKKTKASCEARVENFEEYGQDVPEDGPHQHVIQLSGSNFLLVGHPKLFRDGEPVEEAPPLPPSLSLENIITAIQNGVSAAIAQGPTYRFPVNSTLIRVNFDQVNHLDSTTTIGAISSAARSAVQDALKSSASKADTIIMEPVMMVEISVPEEALGGVIHDLNSARGGHVLSLDAEQDEPKEATVTRDSQRLSVKQLDRIYAPRDPFGSSDSGSTNTNSTGQQRQVRARVPLKEMIGYLKHLRSLTGGRGTFVMSVDQYEKMTSQRMKAALAEIQGIHF